MTSSPQQLWPTGATTAGQRGGEAARALGRLGHEAALVASTGAGRALALVFGGVARARHDRPLHPRGVTHDADLTITGGTSTGVPLLDQPDTHRVTVRLSRATGLPRPLPDIYGIALRLGPDTGAPADVLFASTGASSVGRFVLQPRTQLGGASLTTLLPLRSPAGPLLLRLEAEGGLTVEEGALPPRLVLFRAIGVGPWRRVGALQVGPPSPPQEDSERHDPVVHQLPGTEQYPWVARLREPAYRSARHGAAPQGTQDG